MNKTLTPGLGLTLLTACGSYDPESGDPDARASAPRAEQQIVNFANFIEEIGPDTLEAFTKETGIAVNYDVYETNLVLESKLLVGSTGFDLVAPLGDKRSREPVRRALPVGHHGLRLQG